MKHAALITAYKDFDALCSLVNALSDFSFVYIHVDKKSKIHRVRPDVLNVLREHRGVRLIQSRYSVSWGGINHLYACLGLARAALQEPGHQFFHWITGQDYPVRTPAEFEDFFALHRNNSFVDARPFPVKNWALEDGGFDRVSYYHIYDVLDLGKGAPLNAWFLDLQRRACFKRGYSNRLPALYGGSSYWSLSREAMEYVLRFTSTAPSFLRRLSHCFCAEEIYVQSVLMDSSLAQSIITDNLRYVDWGSTRGGSHPAVLDETDLSTIKAGSAFFARKLSSERSGLLRRLIDSSSLSSN